LPVYPLAWFTWAESLYDAPIQMYYPASILNQTGKIKQTHKHTNTQTHKHTNTTQTQKQ